VAGEEVNRERQHEHSRHAKCTAAINQEVHDDVTNATSLTVIAHRYGADLG
jgi:hypothetical protein